MALAKTKAEFLERSAMNLAPALLAAAGSAEGDCRPADAALFRASVDLLQAFTDELEREAPEEAEPEAKPAKKSGAGHRHKFGEDGRCAVVAGCDAKPRKKAAPPAPTPGDPAAEVAS